MAWRRFWQTVGGNISAIFIGILTVPVFGHAQPAFEKKWTWKPTRWADSSPAIGSDGTLYFGSFDERFWAVDSNGNTQWSFRTGSEIRSSPAIAKDGTIYFGCRDRKFYALTPEGKKKWEYNVDSWVDSSPAIENDGTVYFGAWDQNFYALSPDGSLKWKFSTGGVISSSPAIGRDGSIYFGSYDGKLYALAADGTKQWDFKTGGAILSSPAINSEGDIFFTSLDGFFYALDKEGQQKWRLHTGGITDSSPVIGADGTLFVGVNNSAWSISPDGTKNWDFPMPHPLRTPVVALSNGVLVSSFQGYLIMLNANKAKLAEFPLWGESAASPVITQSERLYLFGTGQWLFAFNFGASTAESDWPKFRGNLRNSGNVCDLNSELLMPGRTTIHSSEK